jgi:hypothetical protein
MKDKKERVSESLRRVLSFDLIPKMLNALASLPGFKDDHSELASPIHLN